MSIRFFVVVIVVFALPLGITRLGAGESETVKAKMVAVESSQATSSQAKNEDDEKDEKKGDGKEKEDEKGEAKKDKSAPKAVQDTVQKLIGKGKFLGLDAEDGNYELDYKVNGVHQAAIIAADGKILEEEITVEASTLPKPVIEAVKKLYPKGKITLAEKSTTKDGSVYEMTITVEHSITVNPEGKVQ